MNILITGASGFIGSHLTTALLQRGHQVTACVRNPEKLNAGPKSFNTIKADFATDYEIHDWNSRLKNIDVVINAVGIIREIRGQTFDALHHKTPCALFEASSRTSVKKVIQVSALGADETAFSQYHLSKRAADDCLKQQDLDWTILQPSIVYGPGAKSMAFFKALSALPLIPLVGKGDQFIQPVHISDLVRTVLQIIDDGQHAKEIIQLVGPEAVSMKQLYAELRGWLGINQARFMQVPYPVTLFVARLVGFLPGTPVSKESVAMLRNGNTSDVSLFVSKTGFKPISFKTDLLKGPAQITDKWFARLFFLKPLLRLTIAFLWLFTAWVSVFVFPVEQSYAMLARAGITGIWAPIMLYGSAMTDLLLGLVTLFAWRLQQLGLVQIGLILLYTVIISFSQPELWFHPFGPVSKNIPLMIAILIMLALEKK